jgi:DNA helicase HerA-like ATPase
MSQPRSIFRFPGADSRTVVIGATGTGKTTFGLWLLSHMRFDRRPWVIMDYKGEALLDDVGFPPLRPLRLGRMPGKRGVYVVSPRPGQDQEVEDFLWKLWARGNVGLFCDEVTLIPAKAAFKAIMRQGRSKLLPVISCTQRPVDVDREVFTEASFVSVFGLRDAQDYKRVREFTGLDGLDRPLPKHWSRWYDVAENKSLLLKPCPSADTIVARFKSVVPYPTFFGA